MTHAQRVHKKELKRQAIRKAKRILRQEAARKAKRLHFAFGFEADHMLAHHHGFHKLTKKQQKEQEQNS